MRPCLLLAAASLLWARLIPASTLPGLRVQTEPARPWQASEALKLPDLYDASISELQELLSEGAVTAVDLAKAYLARISEVNLEIKAVLELNPTALSFAAQSDVERLLGVIRSPLHGIPILVKDNIATYYEDGNTTAGSYALLGSVTGFQSTMVERLKAAGAVVLGKTNMDEWAGDRGSSPSGWSARGNITTSPYYPGGDVCGSSGGSAAATAIGLAAASLGTQTGHSIICPSSRNNLVGIKPTLGRTSRYGVIPISLNLDSVGPIARSVRDAAAVLQAIAGPDPKDTFTLTQPDEVANFSAHLTTDSLKGVRIGVLRRGFTQSIPLPNGAPLAILNYTEVYESFNQSISTLRVLGAEVVDPADLVGLEQVMDALRRFLGPIIGAHDFKADVEQYLNSLHSSPIRTFQDIIDFNNAHPELELPDPKLYGQENMEQAVLTDGKMNATYLNALKEWHRVNMQESFLPSFAKHNVSAFVLPTEPRAGAFAAAYQAPVVTVPMGFLSDERSVPSNATPPYNPYPGQPFGLSFLGPKWSEAQLLGYAYAYEQKTQVRRQRRAYAEATPKTQLEDIIRIIDV